MTQSRHCEIDVARFRKELLFVCCKSDGPSTDRVRQLHEYCFIHLLNTALPIDLFLPHDEQHSPQSNGHDAISSKSSTPSAILCKVHSIRCLLLDDTISVLICQ
ncbi:hypothetical protein KXD40_001128 [Peronospora effusa]|nr:hypothetical protein KXD40_001128 [Peronospora effusa]